MSSDYGSLTRALGSVLAHLPLHAEEGALRESLAEDELLVVLGEAGIGAETSAMLVALLRRQFEVLALLDRGELAQGRWTFVSFPASLLGRALIETLAAPGTALLPADYWEQGDHRPEVVKDEQRALLHRVESERLRQNPAARPVRVVHVACALIRLRQRFLFHRREDRARAGEKTHVLPGGRFNSSDLPNTDLAAGPGVLRQMFDVDSTLVDAHLDSTLVRELDEELGLRRGEDYEFARWHRLPTYRQLAGVGNRHAYSEYGFQLYTLKLTALGETRLLDREAESDVLSWFSADEVAAPQRADGASAFVDALHAAWGDDLAAKLLPVPDSGASDYAMSGETQMLDLPATPDAPWLLGKPGKEKALPLRLTDTEWQFLLLLGWHACGFVVHAGADLRLLGAGWVRVGDEFAGSTGRALLAKTDTLPLLEIRDVHYLRLRIDPAILMVGAGLFSYAIEGSDREGGMLRVERTTIATPWAELAGETVHLPINGNALKILRALERGEDPDAMPGVLAESWGRNLRQQLTEPLRRMGLRKLWTTENKAAALVAGIRRLR